MEKVKETEPMVPAKEKKSRFGRIKKSFVWFKKTRRRNKVFVLIGLLIIGFVVMKKIGGSSNKTQYVTAQVSRSDLTQLVSETGNVSTGARTDVYSPSTGIVEEVYVKNKEQVKVGDQLFKVNSSATEQEQVAARANLLTAQSTLNAAQGQLNELQAQLFTANQTFINGAGSKNPTRDDPNYVIQNANWLAAEAAYKNQQTVISQAQSAVASASLTYQATQNALVKATADGTVANMDLTVGQGVTAKTAATTPPNPALIIKSDQNNPTIQVSLNEIDIPKVNEGQPVEVTLDAFPGKTFKGTVTSVDDIGANNQGVITYNVVIALESSSPEIKPGMTANVDIVVDHASDVLTVPNAAIKPYKGAKAVQIINPKTRALEYVPVKVGIKSTERTQILSGVSEGQEVVTAAKSTKPKTSSPFGG